MATATEPAADAAPQVDGALLGRRPRGGRHRHRGASPGRRSPTCWPGRGGAPGLRAGAAGRHRPARRPPGRARRAGCRRGRRSRCCRRSPGGDARMRAVSDALPDPAAAPPTRGHRRAAGTPPPVPRGTPPLVGAAGRAPAGRRSRSSRSAACWSSPSWPACRSSAAAVALGGRRPGLGLGRAAGPAQPARDVVRARRSARSRRSLTVALTATTRSCAGCRRPWPCSMIVAFLHQLLRRDGRPGWSSRWPRPSPGSPLIVSGSCLVPLPRTADGGAVMAVAGAALAVVRRWSTCSPGRPGCVPGCAAGPGRRHGGGGRRRGGHRRRAPGAAAAARPRRRPRSARRCARSSARLPAMSGPRSQLACASASVLRLRRGRLRRRPGCLVG